MIESAFRDRYGQVTTVESPGVVRLLEAENLSDQRSLRFPHALQCDCDDCLNGDNNG